MDVYLGGVYAKPGVYLLPALIARRLPPNILLSPRGAEFSPFPPTIDLVAASFGCKGALGISARRTRRRFRQHARLVVSTTSTPAQFEPAIRETLASPVDANVYASRR